MVLFLVSDSIALHWTPVIGIKFAYSLPNLSCSSSFLRSVCCCVLPAKAMEMPEAVSRCSLAYSFLARKPFLSLKSNTRAKRSPTKAEYKQLLSIERLTIPQIRKAGRIDVRRGAQFERCMSHQGERLRIWRQPHLFHFLVKIETFQLLLHVMAGSGLSIGSLQNR